MPDHLASRPSEQLAVSGVPVALARNLPRSAGRSVQMQAPPVEVQRRRRRSLGPSGSATGAEPDGPRHHGEAATEQAPPGRRPADVFHAYLLF
jgi:hypothetical protein